MGIMLIQDHICMNKHTWILCMSIASSWCYVFNLACLSLTNWGQLARWTWIQVCRIANFLPYPVIIIKAVSQLLMFPGFWGFTLWHIYFCKPVSYSVVSKSGKNCFIKHYLIYISWHSMLLWYLVAPVLF